jgi:hypothetical protein
MQNLVILDYSFLFDPSETWANLYQFEQEVAQFFEERGMDTKVIKTAQGSSGRRAFLIMKKQVPQIPEGQSAPKKPLTPTKQIEKLSKAVKK